VVITDNRTSTPAPDSFSGEIVLQFNAQNVPAGPFSAYVMNDNVAELIQGDTGKGETFFA